MTQRKYIYSCISNYQVFCPTCSIESISIIVSPRGMTVSELKSGNSSSESYITVTWTPSLSLPQQGPNILCYNATDSFR